MVYSSAFMNDSPLKAIDSTIDAVEDLTLSNDSSWNKHANRRSIIVVFLLAALLASFYAFVNSAPAAFPVNEIVSIPSGSNVRSAAKILADKHIITSDTWLSRIIQVQGKANSVFAGDYVFKERLTMLQVAKRITSGSFGLEPVSITIPEGSTSKEIAKILAKKLMHFDQTTFINEAEKFEGYLFPDTYHVLPNVKEEKLVSIFRDTLTNKLKPYEREIKNSKFNIHEILTIASILEKEESDKKDRHIIAGVLNNRLEINMPLQVDATFLYILGRGTFGLSREDLRHQSPYNTYVNKGLPPGPINNPGLGSILAVLNPTKNPYIFYLADKHGTTYYSKTYEEHLVKKREYIDSQR
jgi:UPF0755 protein